MGIVTDKLNEKHANSKEADDIFALQKLVSEQYQSILKAVTSGGNLYPTGDAEFDAFFQPISQAFGQLKTLLESVNNQEFINWTEPL